MAHDISQSTLELLKSHLADFHASMTWREIVPFKVEVIDRFQPLFLSPRASDLSENDLKEFLNFNVNHHWSNLERQRGRLLANFSNVQNAISQLADASQVISDRFDRAIGAADGLGKATATAIMHVCFPEECGVWNGTSEAFLQKFDLFPAMATAASAGERYQEINSVLLTLSTLLELDLWTLDAFLFYMLSLSQSAWIIALSRPDLERCIELQCFGKHIAGDRIAEVQKGDKIVCYVLKEMKIVALGEVTRGYYQETTKKFLAEGIFEHRFDFSAEYLGPREFSVSPIANLLSSIPENGNFGLLVRSGFRKIDMQDWQIFESAAFGVEPKAIDSEVARRQWWWVNQSATFTHEQVGGYIWAPQRAKNGSQLFHHLNVSKVKKNDIIFHYANQKIVAVGVASDDGGPADIPKEINSGAWLENGFSARVIYHNLSKTDMVPRDAIPLGLRQKLAAETQMPFAGTGEVNQGYLYAIPESFARSLIEQFPQLVPPRLDDNKSAANTTLLLTTRPLKLENSVFEDFCRFIATMRVNREGGKPRLYKPAMLLAILNGIEAGKFGDNKIRFAEINEPFIQTLASYGLTGGESQAAKGFYHLSNEPFFEIRSKSDQLPVQSGDLNKVRAGVDFACFPDTYWDVVADANLRAKLIELTKRIWFEDLTNSIQKKDFDLSTATHQLIDSISRAGFVYEPWQIAAYITAIRTKPFLILAGISGTGKSELPKLVAGFTGGEFSLISVKPDWTDSADVLGYVQLDGNFLPGKLLEKINDASKNPSSEFSVVVDEMNLAKVEYYFAEILSHIEDVRSKTPSKSGLITQRVSPSDQHWAKLTVSANLALIGTVNMDESSHGFSRKVLDRAFTLEFSDIDLSIWKTKKTDKLENAKWPVHAWRGRANRLSELEELEESENELIEKTIEKLIRINEFLSPAQLQLGYRSRDEIVLFVLNAADIAEEFRTARGTSVKPFDLAMQMKVLPRIAGGSAAIIRLVRELLGWTYNGQPCKDDEAANILVRELSQTTMNFPKTCERLAMMWERLQSEGYTSYWL